MCYFRELPSLTSSASNADVCARSAADVQAWAYNPASRIEVQNQGGLLGGGVCWWHSRLQRSALYLATFRPELPRATHGQGVAIINALAKMSQVVAIPGYASFNDFSRDYEREIIARLEAWQRSDGFLHFRWVDGLKGHWRVAPGHAPIDHDEHRRRSSTSSTACCSRSCTSTASLRTRYLVIGSRKTAQGYDIDLIDSNHPTETLTISYHVGQTSLYTADGCEAFVPYLDFDGDMGHINGALQRFCGTTHPVLN